MRAQRGRLVRHLVDVEVLVLLELEQLAAQLAVHVHGVLQHCILVEFHQECVVAGESMLEKLHTWLRVTAENRIFVVMSA